jgi:two-component system, chemotaxis family, response regulator Rcp1
MSNGLQNSRPIEVLLAEDSEHDVELTRIGFEKARLAINLHHVEDGEQCLAFLRREGKYADAPTPDLLLLDLNMPILDGREVLSAIVEDERLRHLPVVVLTTSREATDIQSMYKLRCSSYITKPVDFDQFVRVVRTLTDYWFTVVVLPSDQH